MNWDDDPVTVRERLRGLRLQLRSTFNWWFVCRHHWFTPTKHNTHLWHQCRKRRWHTGGHRSRYGDE